jgi:GntR family transcriptional repressor for pyruvate dehydrogenase complex
MPRLHERILEDLIGEIVGERIKPEESLPREADLVDRYGVSRGVVREAIRGLEDRGLVKVKHGVGATVTHSDDWAVIDRDVLAALIHSDNGAQVLGEYLEARRILEVEAAGLAAERAKADHLTELSDAFARMTETAERARTNPAAERLYQEADIAFHRAVVVATGNRVLSGMNQPIDHALVTAVPPLARPDTRFERTLPEHKKILGAIVDGDPAAARDAMREHLGTVEGNLRDYASARKQKPRRR